MLKPSESIGKYVIERELGSGAMGTVFLGYDPNLDRRAAVKIMKTGVDDDVLRSRFFLEARSAAKLDHPNIVRIWDLDTDSENRPYIAMEYIEGVDLKTIIEEKRFLSFDQKLQIVIQVCRGLHHAHTNGVIHRDIKPGNIRINKNGQAKILDFGLARLESGDSSTRTRGCAIGTPYYMSPEQWRGSPDPDRRTDLFSLGAVLYELIAYARPFEAEDISGLMNRIISEPYTPLEETLPECGPEISQILDRALAKERDERFPSGLEFAYALEDFQARLDLRCRELRKKIDRVQTELDRCVRKSAELKMAELLGSPLVHNDLAEGDGRLGENVPADKKSDFGFLLDHHACLQRRLDSITEKLRAALPLLRLLKTAHRNFQEGELETCEKNLRELLRLCPNNRAGLRLMDACYKARDQQRHQTEQRMRVQSVLEQARAAIERGEFPRALQIIGRILEIDTSNSEALALCDTIRQRQASEGG